MYEIIKHICIFIFNTSKINKKITNKQIIQIGIPVTPLKSQNRKNIIVYLKVNLLEFTLELFFRIIILEIHASSL